MTLAEVNSLDKPLREAIVNVGVSLFLIRRNRIERE